MINQWFFLLSCWINWCNDFRSHREGCWLIKISMIWPFQKKKKVSFKQNFITRIISPNIFKKKKKKRHETDQVVTLLVNELFSLSFRCKSTDFFLGLLKYSLKTKKYATWLLPKPTSTNQTRRKEKKSTRNKVSFSHTHI